MHTGTTIHVMYVRMMEVHLGQRRGVKIGHSALSIIHGILRFDLS